MDDDEVDVTLKKGQLTIVKAALAEYAENHPEAIRKTPARPVGPSKAVDDDFCRFHDKPRHPFIGCADCYREKISTIF